MPASSLPRLLAALAASAIVVGTAFAADSPEQTRFFESKIRPVLITHCYSCHAEKKQKGGLRVDSRAAIIAGGDQGAAAVPGKPAESLLVKAVRYESEELHMPPTGKLPPAVVADLSRWVQMGMPWPGETATTAAPARRGEFQISEKDRAHWAFQPVKKQTPPRVKDAGWVRNPIDAFILAGLEAKGLSPASTASKATLIRRLTYDLTGLPPTPAEVAAFVADPSPDAYEKLVDRLLASPHYGEQWGRHWLDLVRYAETNSFERDNPKPNAWRYRDYVIQAFNADKPYDRFVREQLAGDELPDGGNEGIVATGYYRLGIWDDEPADREQSHFDVLDDIVATTGQVFLGMTVDCARCHDHKIDPFPQKDYYRLLSFFHNIAEFRNGGPTDEAPLPMSEADRREVERHTAMLATRKQDIERGIRAIENDFVNMSPSAAKKVATSDLQNVHYRFYRDTWDKLPDFASLRHESEGVLPDRLFDLSPRTRDTAFGFVFESVLNVPETGKYTFQLDSDDGARLTIRGKVVAVYDGIHGLGKPVTTVVELPVGRSPIKLEYFQRTAGFGLSLDWSGPGVTKRSLSAPAGKRRTSGVGSVAAAIRRDGKKVLGEARFNEYVSLQRELRELRTRKPSTPMALCVTETGSTPRETFVQIRGNPHVRGDRVEPAFPLILGGGNANVPTPSPGAKTTGRRKALADWIVSQNNPISARVVVNRVWQYHFGRGIVRSSSNFGLQGDKPTHPELLDWLAAELVQNGWKLKQLHRLIVTSSAYRMSSGPNPAAYAKDPANDSFWRFDRRRLTAEEIRDSILSVTGELSPHMGGPSVYPPIQAEVLAGQSRPGYGWGSATREEASRRSVYVHVKRSLLLPILESFDLAEADRSTAVRFASTQPTQALSMLNGPFLQESARHLVERVRKEAGADSRKQIARMLELTMQRPPSASDVDRAETLRRGLQEKDGMSADAAIKAVALLALNLNEFVYLD